MSHGSLLDLIVCIDLEKLSDSTTCEIIKFEYDKEILDHVIRDTKCPRRYFSYGIEISFRDKFYFSAVHSSRKRRNR